jgi:4-hydroxybutyrate CoA-transferase
VMKDGSMVSKIVPTLKPGAGVVTGRNHVHYIVTEYGVADMYGKSIRQRVNALVGIAHPDFRADLEKQARELHWI